MHLYLETDVEVWIKAKCWKQSQVVRFHKSLQQT